MLLTMTLCLICWAQSLWAAQLERSRGPVTLNGKKVVSKGQQLKTGDRLSSSGKGNFFVVKYDDGSRFLVKDGELTIDKLQGKSTEIGLLRGTFLSFVEPKSKNQLSIKTRTASLGVRGTKFWVTESPKETYLCVCEGEVEIANDTGSVIVEKNEDIRVSSRGHKLKKSLATNVMWGMAIGDFKELGFDIPPM